MPSDTATKLDELLASLAEYAGESKDKKREVALKLLDNEGTKEIGEVLLKKGIGKRTAEATGKATELETQLTEARDQLAEAKQQIKDLESKEPNWQRRLEDNDKKWQAKLDAEQQKTAAERRTRVSEKVQLERQKFRAALRIGQDGGVDEDYGKLLPANYDDRFLPDEDSDTVKILELGEKDSYYDPAAGDPAEQLAKDVLAKLPPKVMIVGNPEGGGGTQGGRSGPVKPKTAAQIQEAQAKAVGYASP